MTGINSHLSDKKKSKLGLDNQGAYKPQFEQLGVSRLPAPSVPGNVLHYYSYNVLYF